MPLLIYKNTIDFDIWILYPATFLGFPDSSVSKESACNTGDPGLIPRSGRYPGEGIGYPL